MTNSKLEERVTKLEKDLKNLFSFISFSHRPRATLKSVSGNVEDLVKSNLEEKYDIIDTLISLGFPPEDVVSRIHNPHLSMSDSQKKMREYILQKYGTSTFKFADEFYPSRFYEIIQAQNEEALVEYLLDNDSFIRLLAGKRLEELKNANI